MPRLSLCLMVKNEEARLARAIESFQGLAEEIIVVDTGSSDRTPEIAAGLGAQVSEIPWNDDFAAVRNALFEKATGEWIFHLDADEALRPESKAELRQLLDRPELQGAYVLRQDIWASDEPDRFTEMVQVRLFRREGLPLQIGRCHPHFEPDLEIVAASMNRQLAKSSVRLRHWGYVAERRREKLERGAHLMRLELQERPGQLYYLAELARTLYDLSDPHARPTLHEAAEALAEELRRGFPPSTGALVLLEAMLSLPQEEIPDDWPLERVRQIVLEWFPHAIPIHWQLARRAFEEEDFPEALRRLETIRELIETGRHDQTVSFNPAIVGDELWLNLGVCRLRNADLDGAEACFQRIEGSGPFADAAGQNLAIVQSLRTTQHK